MSKKAITPVPGLHRAEEKDHHVKLPLATKVTGRNLGAVNYLVSLAAERAGQPASTTAVFNKNGSLDRVIVHAPPRVIVLTAGDYVYLNHNEDRIRHSEGEYYDGRYVPVEL